MHLISSCNIMITKFNKHIFPSIKRPFQGCFWFLLLQCLEVSHYLDLVECQRCQLACVNKRCRHSPSKFLAEQFFKWIKHLVPGNPVLRSTNFSVLKMALFLRNRFFLCKHMSFLSCSCFWHLYTYKLQGFFFFNIFLSVTANSILRVEVFRGSQKSSEEVGLMGLSLITHWLG